MNANRIRIITIFIAAIVGLTTIICCSFDVLHAYPKIYMYTDLSEKQIEAISSYYKLENKRIKRIEKLVYIQAFTDSEMYIFAEVDWPDLWSSFSYDSSDYSSLKINNVGYAEKESFSYDFEVSFESNRDTFRVIHIYRLFDDSKVVLYISPGAARELWNSIAGNPERVGEGAVIQ